MGWYQLSGKFLGKALLGYLVNMAGGAGPEEWCGDEQQTRRFWSLGYVGMKDSGTKYEMVERGKRGGYVGCTVGVWMEYW